MAQNSDPAGQMTVTGDFIQNGGTLEIDFWNLNGTPGDGWGFLYINGDATLDGALALDFSRTNTNLLAPGQQFEILYYGGSLQVTPGWLQDPGIPGSYSCSMRP